MAIFEKNWAGTETWAEFENYDKNLVNFGK